MSDRASSEKLDSLHSQLAEAFTVAIKPEPVVIDGEVVGHKYNAACLSAARQFLKDNGIEGPSKPALGSLAAALTKAPLPFPGEDDSVVPIQH